MWVESVRFVGGVSEMCGRSQCNVWVESVRCVGGVSEMCG